MTTERDDQHEESGAGEPVRPPVGDPSGAAGSGRGGAHDKSSRGAGGGAGGRARDDEVEDEAGGGKRPLGDGIRQSLGVLSAFRDALEETIQEARDRGELSTDRAREMMQQALHRAREAAGEARGRLDFAPQHELDALRTEVEGLRVRVQQLETRLGATGRDSEGEDQGVSYPGGQSPPSP